MVNTHANIITIAIVITGITHSHYHLVVLHTVEDAVAAETKVSELDVAVLADQKIVWLQIPMMASVPVVVMHHQ